MTDSTRKNGNSGQRKKLGQYLLEEGLIQEEELAAILKDQENRPEKLGRLLIDKKVVSDVQLAKILARQHRLPFARLRKVRIPADVLDLIPSKLGRLHGLVPVQRTADDLIVATAFPSQYYEMEKDIRFVVQMRIKAVVAPESDIFWALDAYYPRSGSPTETDTEAIAVKDIEIIRHEETQDESVADIEKIAGLPPVVRFTNSIFAEGILMGASDIHLEPHKDFVVVRFRIDGILRPILRTQRKNHFPVVSRIKIMAGLDISIRRQPQDGKAQIRYGGKVFDLRVSTLPTFYGEKVTIRILDPAFSKLTPEQLGLSPENLDRLLEAVNRPDGLVVVTGPTGSGKTSTLYACLNKINTPEVNIVTVEDPVELDVEGINQVQINTKAGVTFAAALRSILRQDPDIVMVGEIRDVETAAVSMQAAQTGHLVLSTLHTNDAPSVLTRLMNLQVDPFLVSTSLILAIGQRLVRKICPGCKVQAPLEESERRQISSFLKDPNAVFWEGSGCEACDQTGYKGRMGIFELLFMSPALKKAIGGDFSLTDFIRTARAEGFRTMFEDGLEKALQGLTSVSELLRTATPRQEESNDRGSVSLPRKQSAASPEPIQTPSGATGPDWRIDQTPAFTEETFAIPRPRQTTVLVVDDNPDLLAVLKRTLEKEDFGVLTAENGAKGLALALERHPTLIITDFKMPVMDGFTLIKELKKDPTLGSVPIIMLTAKDEVDTEVAVLDAGADDYVVKPVDRRRFVARVKRLLK